MRKIKAKIDKSNYVHIFSDERTLFRDVIERYPGSYSHDPGNLCALFYAYLRPEADPPQGIRSLI
jgi:hypothetical protein